MRILVVHNFEDTGLGQLGAALADAGASLDVRMAQRGETLPLTADDHDALVILGGGQNALDDHHSPHFPALLSLIRDFASADRAVLGICLGSQLIARAFGGANRIGGATEFGWHEVRLLPDAGSDPVFAGLPSVFPIFQWHDDTFDLPPGAVRLAESRTAANQAFRLGRAVYAVQFHFEADRSLVRDWSATFAAAIAERQPGWSARMAADEDTLGRAADQMGRRIAETWIGTIEPSSVRRNVA